MNEIIEQLEIMNIKHDKLTEIRTKAGVSVFRVEDKNTSYVIKYFENESDRREIKNYEILKQLGVPSLQIIAATDKALILEDILISDRYRLGVQKDLNDPDIARNIAKWYKFLHQKGAEFVAEHGDNMYDENDVITMENIDFVKKKTQTHSNLTWKLIENNFGLIKKEISNVSKTLTYNDFYYTNLITARDKTEAFMYDYNLLGKSYVYVDIRNVCYSLGEGAERAFLSEYGDFDKKQVAVDEVASVIITLYTACTREAFPQWGAEALESFKNNFGKKVKELIG